MAFDRPDAPGRDPDAPQFDPNQHLGDLLVVQVSDLMESVETEYGDRPVVVADVYVIQRDATISATYPEAWLFGTVLFSQLKKKKGRTVLGVLEQGEKRPGKKPPWRLADPTDAQEAVALRAMASKPDAPEPEKEPASDPWSVPEPATVGGAEKAPWE
jgi:hypothetical protein